MSYKKTLETISKIENIENITKLIDKPRLSVFKDICDPEISIEQNLLDDADMKYREALEFLRGMEAAGRLAGMGDRTHTNHLEEEIVQ